VYKLKVKFHHDDDDDDDDDVSDVFFGISIIATLRKFDVILTVHCR